MAKILRQERGPGRRFPKGSCFPPRVHEAIRKMARQEHKTESRIQAEIIYDWFGLDETGWYAKGERKRNGRSD